MRTIKLGRWTHGAAQEIFFALAAPLLVLGAVGFFSLDFRVPLKVHEDILFFLLNFKSLALYGSMDINPAVAWPPGGDWMVYPILEMPPISLLRGIGLWTTDVLTAFYVYLFVCFSTAAVSGYAALRCSGFSRAIALGGAVLFGASPFMLGRAGVHPFYCFTAALPWILRFALLIPYQGPRLGKPGFYLSPRHALFIGVLAGTSGLYYAFFSGFFIVLAGLVAGLRGKRGISAALWSLVGLAVTFNLWLAPHYLAMAKGEGAFPARDVFDQARYGFRIPDLLVPDFWPFSRAMEVFRQTQSRIAGEGNHGVMGLWGIVGIVGACAEGLRRAFAGARRSYMRRGLLSRVALLFCLVAILFALPYGLGFIFNMFIGSTIRAQARVAVFLGYILIVMGGLFFARMTSKPAQAATILTVVLLSLMPVAFGLVRQQKEVTESWRQTRADYEEILEIMDRQELTHIAQIPAYPFPEGPGSPAFGNSDHFWPYLLDTNTARRWSFGSMEHQPLWRNLALGWADGAQRMDNVLRCLGFDAVLIEKQAFSPVGLAGVTRYLADRPASQILVNTSRRALVLVPATKTVEKCNF